MELSCSEPCFVVRCALLRVVLGGVGPEQCFVSLICALAWLSAAGGSGTAVSVFCAGAVSGRWMVLSGGNEAC